jgi:colicin import membrane protein
LASQTTAQPAAAPPIPATPSTPPEKPKAAEPPAIRKTDIVLKDEKKKKPIEKKINNKDTLNKDAEKKPVEKKPVEKKTAETKEPSKKDTPKKEITPPTDKPDPTLAKLRNEELGRALAAAGGSAGAATANANGARGDPNYGDRIRSRILGNVVFNNASEVNGNPEAVFMVEQLPTGDIISIKKVRSSGIAAWDDAVERAIRKSDPLPKAKNGTTEKQLELTFRPKDVR